MLQFSNFVELHAQHIFRTAESLSRNKRLCNGGVLAGEGIKVVWSLSMAWLQSIEEIKKKYIYIYINIYI